MRPKYYIAKFKDGFEVWRNNKVVLCCFDFDEYDFVMKLLANSNIKIQEIEEFNLFCKDCR